MLLKLWNGNYSLAKTYWLFYVIGWGVFSIPIRWFGAINEKLQAEYANLVMLALCLFVSYGSVVLVGLWRSASNYAGTKLWAILAKIIVCIGVLIQLLTILAVGKPSPLHGGILTLSALIPLVAMYLIQAGKNKKHILLGSICFGLIIPAGLFFTSQQSIMRANWTPLVNSYTIDFSDDSLKLQKTYLDFNSITQKNGRVYAYIANDFFDGELFTKSTKQLFEFDCATPARLRVLTVVSYKNKIIDGFGEEMGRDDDVQATIAKSVVANGKTYTGGWSTYDTLQKDAFKYCENPVASSKFEAKVNKYFCSVAQRDLTILKAVCENR